MRREQQGIIGIKQEALDSLRIRKAAGESDNYTILHSRLGELSEKHPELHKLLVMNMQEMNIQSANLYFEGASDASGLILDSLPEQAPLNKKEIGQADDDINGLVIGWDFNPAIGLKTDFSEIVFELRKDHKPSANWLIKKLDKFEDGNDEYDYFMGFSTILMPFIRRGYIRALARNIGIQMINFSSSLEKIAADPAKE